MAAVVVPEHAAPPAGATRALRAAFVMEQTLGHVTHAQNLRGILAERSDVDATWIPVPFGVSGIERFVPAYGHNWSVRASYRARRALGRIIAQRPQDVLFFHTQVTALLSVGLMRRVPAILSLDATPLNFDEVGAAYEHQPAGDGWVDARKHQLNRAAFGAARAIVAWSEWAAASLVRDYAVPRERIVVNAPGAAQRYFAIGEARPQAVAAVSPVRLLFVGGDLARKGGFQLLEAVRAARTLRAFELHLVTRDAVPATPGVIVHRGLGPNSPELLDLFRTADAFVLPSLGECFGIALMEAAAAGLPIVATGVGAMREAAVDGRSAIVVSVADVRSLRQAIERLVDDEALRGRLGRAGHALARAKFDADRNNRVILDLLASVARPTAWSSVA